MADWKVWEADNVGTPSVAVNHGYDVYTTHKQSTGEGANALLRDPADHTQIKLWVSSLETNLSLSGTTGQGYHTRDFYAHNFVQPSFTLTCQAPGQKHAGRIAEFIRKAQRNCLSHNTRMALLIPGNRWPNSKTMKGHRRPFYAYGYVTSMPRAHRAHDPAPNFEIEFVIAQMRSGIFQDTPYKAYKLARWSEIVENIISKNLVEPPHVERPTKSGDDFGDIEPNLPTLSPVFPGLPTLSDQPPVDLSNP